MESIEKEIVVEDPTAPDASSPPVTSNHAVNVVVMLLLIAIAGLLAFDNYRTGMSWEATGPQAGYVPFYLSLILAGAALFGLISTLRTRNSAAPDTFVTYAQLRRVSQVFVPTFLFVLATAWLGIYLASFILIAGFMWSIGRIALWKSALTALIFAVAMFLTFQVAFDVIMPKGPLEAAFGF